MRRINTHNSGRWCPLALVLVLCASSLSFGNGAELSAHLGRYDKALDRYIRNMTQQNWPSAFSDAGELLLISKALHGIGIADSNDTFIYYASNLIHHCEELLEVTADRESVQATYLVSILIGHIEQIQSANPVWLRSHVAAQIGVLENAIRNRDAPSARNAAEIIHASATGILLSISSAPDTYAHTHWSGNIILVNGIGDEILGAVNRNEWQDVPDKLDHIKHIFRKWTDGFRNIPGSD